jgi:hypothetical protein
MKEQIRFVDVNPQPQTSAAGVSVLTLPGGRIHGIEIYGQGALEKMAESFGDLRLLIGGNQQRVATLTQISDALSLYGAQFAVQNNLKGKQWRLFLPFSEPWRDEYLAKERFALDNPTDGNGVPLRDMQIEIDYKDTANAKSLAFRALVEPLNEVTDKTVHNALTKYFRKPYGITSDEIHILDLPRRGVYQLIELYDPTGAAISEVKVKIDGKYRFHRTKTEQDQDLKRWGMSPREGVFSIVPDITDSTADGWNMQNVREFIIEVTCDGAATGNITCIYHVFGLPE